MQKILTNSQVNNTLKQVSVLFVMKNSIYKNLNVDCWDKERNALLFCGKNPVIVHPPCRAWGRLSYFSNHTTEEKNMAIWALQVVRQNGGILEHPAYSRLWNDQNLPLGNQVDSFGGFTIDINQHWFGHRAEKKTWLYICGIEKHKLPAVELNFDAVEYVIGNSKVGKKQIRYRKEITKREREETPLQLALWLISIARSCKGYY